MFLSPRAFFFLLNLCFQLIYYYWAEVAILYFTYGWILHKTSQIQAQKSESLFTQSNDWYWFANMLACKIPENVGGMWY